MDGIEEKTIKFKFIPSVIFKELSKVVYLDVHDVELESIEADDLKKAKSLESLCIVGNPIKSLGPRVFQHAVKLKYMKFEKCGLKFLHQYTFDGLKNLERVHLIDNPIVMIHCLTFRNIRTLVKLESISCMDNFTTNTNTRLEPMIYESSCHNQYSLASENNLHDRRASSQNWAIVCSLFSCCFCFGGLLFIYLLLKQKWKVARRVQHFKANKEINLILGGQSKILLI